MQRNDDHLRQGRSLFLQTVHDVIAASKSLSLTNEDGSSSSNDNDEATRHVDCARIRIDGSIISSSLNDGDVGGKRRREQQHQCRPSAYRKFDRWHRNEIGTWIPVDLM
jgi:hypothetical protein